MSSASCSWTADQAKTTSTSNGLDICKTDLKIFKFTEEEFTALSETNKKNAALLNCTLATTCKVKLNYEKLCKTN